MLRGKPVGWEADPEGDPVALLVLRVIQQALTDLTLQPDKYKMINPVAARRWLLEEAPGLLADLGLEEYIDQLLALVEAVPEPTTYQLPLLEMA